MVSIYQYNSDFRSTTNDIYPDSNNFLSSVLHVLQNLSQDWLIHCLSLILKMNNAMQSISTTQLEDRFDFGLWL